MKTNVSFVKTCRLFTLLLILVTAVLNVNAQSASELVFKNPSLSSGQDLKKGAVYLFKSVSSGIDATVTISDLVNGAEVKKIDDNSGGLGYSEAFQPEIKSGQHGESYALFTIKFIEVATNSSKLLKKVQATSLDIDGNDKIKEFSEINMNGGSATYMGGTREISLLNLSILNSLFKKFRADNVSGLEKNAIDTSSKGNMYTATKSDVSTFTVAFGAISNNTSTARQYSLYMSGFMYPNQVSLPLDLLSFTAILDKENVDLEWTTASEKNVSHFVIEKSYDGKSFADAGNVFAYGNTTEKKNYSYGDNAILNSGIIYYRLRCIDVDGQFTYSPTRMIRFGQQVAGVQVLTYPNPFVNELRVTVPENLQGKELKIELFNSNGQLVKTKTALLASQTETVSAIELGRGFYTVRVTSGALVTQSKVVKS